MPVTRALGQALPKPDAESVDTDTQPSESVNLCYKLDLYPADGIITTLTGRFLSSTIERHRSRSGFVPDSDRWVLDTVKRPGGITLPKLRWARRAAAQPETPAHLALAFDLFDSKVVCQAENTLPMGGAIEAHGLALMPTKEFKAGPNPRWLNFIPAQLSGNKHPVARGITERQIKLHNTILRATARHLGGVAGDWPVLVTEVSPSQDELLQKLHELCDWVITIDHNAGMEYFDSPIDLPKLYSVYIIDCVPERDDLGFLQLITSTSRFDEIQYLLEITLRELGLAANKHNCELLLNAIKGVSGRLVLRMARNGTVVQEMIALALVHLHCRAAEQYDKVWLALNYGFFIPIDDVPELLHSVDDDVTLSKQRSDLLYVSVNKRGLLITLVEIKFYQDLTTARSPESIASINSQLDASCSRWNSRFSPYNSALAHTIHRASLARILRFYARKGRRYGLNEQVYQDILSAIDRLVQEPDYSIPTLDEVHSVGYIFCPEYQSRQPDKISDNMWVFGPNMLVCSK